MARKLDWTKAKRPTTRKLGTRATKYARPQSEKQIAFIAKYQMYDHAERAAGRVPLPPKQWSDAFKKRIASRVAKAKAKHEQPRNRSIKRLIRSQKADSHLNT